MIDGYVCNCLLIRCYDANVEIISLRNKPFDDNREKAHALLGGKHALAVRLRP